MPLICDFTDIDNLAGIFEAGELRCHRDAPTTVEVGSASIKASRTSVQVHCGPGGMVCDYVPFYYAPRSPMLNTIMRGNVDGVSSDQRRLSYLVSSTEAAYSAGLKCVFTDGNAAAAFTDFSDDPQHLETLVDWPLMKSKWWFNTDDDPDRRRRRMAEFLIHEAAPLEIFTQVVVLNDAARAKVASIAEETGWDVSVHIRPGWYF